MERSLEASVITQLSTNPAEWGFWEVWIFLAAPVAAILFVLRWLLGLLIDWETNRFRRRRASKVRWQAERDLWAAGRNGGQDEFWPDEWPGEGWDNWGKGW